MLFLFRIFLFFYFELCFALWIFDGVSFLKKIVTNNTSLLLLKLILLYRTKYSKMDQAKFVEDCLFYIRNLKKWKLKLEKVTYNLAHLKKTRWVILLKTVIKGLITRSRLARMKFHPEFPTQFLPRYYMEKSQWVQILWYTKIMRLIITCLVSKN